MPDAGQLELLDAMREICDLLAIYPVSTPQQVIDAVTILRSNADERQFTIHCLCAERTTLLEALKKAGVADVQGVSLDEIEKYGFRL